MPMSITAQILSTIGLAMGMAGVALIFRWGPPLPDFSEAVGIAVEDDTVLADGTKVADIVQKNQRRKRRHQTIARTGLGLIFLGFAFQLISVWAI